MYSPDLSLEIYRYENAQKLELNHSGMDAVSGLGHSQPRDGRRSWVQDLRFPLQTSWNLFALGILRALPLHLVTVAKYSGVAYAGDWDTIDTLDSDNTAPSICLAKPSPLTGERIPKYRPCALMKALW